MIAVGMDCGAGNTKTVIIQDGRIMGRGSVSTGFDQAKAVETSLEQALEAAGFSRDDVHRIGGTGSGKTSIKEAGTDVDDMKAMAKAARYFFPQSRTVVDVGAEEGRVVKLDEKGGVLDFAVNEKCAAGAGTFIESMARALEVGIEDMGPLSLKSGKKIPMNAQCVIFAESEVVGLIHARTAKTDISRAIHDAMAGRIASMMRLVGVSEDVVMLGGVGRNPGFVEALKRELNLETLLVPDAPEFGAAVGAALVVFDGGKGDG